MTVALASCDTRLHVPWTIYRNDRMLFGDHSLRLHCETVELALIGEIL